MQRIGGLDGLRGLAAASVLGFHLTLPGFALGWLGVMLFFALSGFLITRTLLTDTGSPTYYRDFYWRRAFRIFPIYFMTIVAVLAIGWARHWDLSPWPCYFLYLQNWLPALGYSTVKTLGPTWTLAIEEQFYLVWPLVVALSTRKALTFVCLAIIVAAPLYRFAMMPDGRFIATTPALVDMLAWGALLALHPRAFQVRSRIGAALLALGAFAVFASWRGYWLGWITETDMNTSAGAVVLISVFGLASAGLIVLAASARLGSILNFKPLRYCGRISYGIYLYHAVIVLSLPSFGIRGLWPTAAVTIALTLLLAVLSYEYLERPLIRFARDNPPRSGAIPGRKAAWRRIGLIGRIGA